MLNGRTGKPLSNEHVILKGQGTPGSADPNPGSADGKTDAAGWLEIPTESLDPAGTVQLYVDGFHIQCAPLPAVSFPLPQIRSTGIVSQNNCKASITASPVPGTLILYVRDETLFEKLAH